MLYHFLLFMGAFLPLAVLMSFIGQSDDETRHDADSRALGVGNDHDFSNRSGDQYSSLNDDFLGRSNHSSLDDDFWGRQSLLNDDFWGRSNDGYSSLSDDFFRS